MLHRVKTTTLGRTAAHRKSLLRNMASDLVLKEKIVSTLPKVKFLKPYFEKLITRAKKGNDFNNVKYMKTKLISDEAVRKILAELGPRFLERKGGYTRITKIGNRVGDNASLARIELVEKSKKKETSIKNKKAEEKTKIKEKKEKVKESKK